MAATILDPNINAIPVGVPSSALVTGTYVATTDKTEEDPQAICPLSASALSPSGSAFITHTFS
jgi:hypothetical protein